MSGIIVGLDIGTSYTRVAIGQLDDEGNLKIIGIAKKPSEGLRNGVIVNIDAAANSIRQTIEAAELMAGVDVSSVYTAIGGSLVEGRTSGGSAGVDPTGRNRRLEISEESKGRALDAASAIVLPLDKKTLHVIPQEYIVDEMTDIRNPIGNLGVRLEVKVYIVSASKTACANIDLCVKRTGFMLNGIMLKTLAAALATLREEEMELGSILIDLGANTTDVMVIYRGAPIYITSIMAGGNYVTNDIVQVKGIPFADAEEIKISYGCCWIEGNENDEEVVIREIGARPAEQTTRYELCEIIQPRMAETMELVRKDVIKHSGLTKLNGSIVLTGGGALMPGIIPLAQNVWGTSSVRIGECPNFGKPDDLDGTGENEYKGPDFATVVGLVMANKGAAKSEKSRRKPKLQGQDGSQSEGFGGKFREFLKKFF